MFVDDDDNDEKNEIEYEETQVHYILDDGPVKTTFSSHAMLAARL